MRDTTLAALAAVLIVYLGGAYIMWDFLWAKPGDWEPVTRMFVGLLVWTAWFICYGVMRYEL